MESQYPNTNVTQRVTQRCSPLGTRKSCARCDRIVTARINYLSKTYCDFWRALKNRGHSPNEKHEDLHIDQTRTSFVAEHVQQKCPVAEQLSVSQMLQNKIFVLFTFLHTNYVPVIFISAFQ